MKTDSKSRVGIYAGTFNPVHLGHVTFALQACQTLGLEKVYFLPERKPRHKAGVEHLGHRIAMIRRAARPHRQLDVLELPDRNFSVVRTMPQLKRLLPSRELVFLLGSDVAVHLPNWDNVRQLYREASLFIGVRSASERESLEKLYAEIPELKGKIDIIDVAQPLVSSTVVRRAIAKRKRVVGLLESVLRYSRQEWLYVNE